MKKLFWILGCVAALAAALLAANALFGCCKKTEEAAEEAAEDTAEEARKPCFLFFCGKSSRHGTYFIQWGEI